MRFIRAFAFLFKGFYDILASYVLAWVVFFALTAYGFYGLVDLLALELGYGSQDMLWKRVAQITGLSPRWTRFPLFLFAHIALIYLGRGLIRWSQRQIERAATFLARKAERSTHGAPVKKAILGGVFTVTVSVLLVAFVLQPTMVPFNNSLDSWGWRLTNLLDGSASDALTESTVGFYRRVMGTADVHASVASEADYDRAQRPPREPTAAPKPTGKQPLMDRWDPLIGEAAAGDADLFAKTKAFMWVESAGHQFALSRTACAGLMQFCLGTARSEPYRSIYGVGEVSACNCPNRRCVVPKAVKRALETGGAAALEAHRADFPCGLGDARFNPKKAITAGATYIDRLRKRHGGNVYLMYIGYNSGPAVSRAVYEKLGRNPKASLADIERHLEPALQRYYGESAGARARSLLKIHLPKIRKAERRYARPS
jgi:hypothetical protein